VIEERLKHVAEIRISNVDKKSAEGQIAVRLCNYTDVYYNERIVPTLDFMSATATADQRLAFGLRVGDVLLTKDSETPDDIGVASVVAADFDDLICGYHLALLRPRSDRADGRYLRWALASTVARQRLSASANGITRFGLRLDAIADLSIPIWSLATQRAIADYLDRETARIDALIAAKNRMVDLLNERFHVARIDIVTGGRYADRQTGPQWLGLVPSNWKISRLKFVAKMDSGHTPNRQVDAYWLDCTIPWVTLNDVGNLEASWRFAEPKNSVSELGLQNSSAHVLPPDAVAMSRDATVGRAALLGIPMAVSQHFVAWVCGPDLMPEYLLNVIRGPMQQYFGSLTAGATIATIGMPDLDQLVVPLPPVGEQRAIVAEVGGIERLSRQMTDAVRQQIILMQVRRQALITEAVTGTLSVPGAAA
jgi:type I restriction enzyme, S subunit